MQELRDHLRALGEGKVWPKDLSEGVCFEVKQKFGTAFMWDIMDIIEDWPDHCGDPSFPVEGKEAYMSTDNLWKHANGNKRRRLCLWLADNV